MTALPLLLSPYADDLRPIDHEALWQGSLELLKQEGIDVSAILLTAAENAETFTSHGT